MVTSRNSFVFLVLMLMGLSSAKAALIGTCTFSAGCGPDVFVTGLNVGYSYNGSIGTLTVTGTSGNASFLPDQLGPWPDAADMTLAIDPDVSIPVSNATALGNKDFTMSITVDGSGNLQTGSISMNGKISQFFSSFNNTNPAFQTPGSYTATANGVALDGALIAAGSSITAIGFQDTTLDFRAALDASSLMTMAGLGSTGSGILSLSGVSSSSGLIAWDESWAASSATLDVVVPVPAALWLFLSGFAALFSASRAGVRK